MFVKRAISKQETLNRHALRFLAMKTTLEIVHLSAKPALKNTDRNNALNV
jgi:hypothetical protein